jgi:hypothetical protein
MVSICRAMSERVTAGPEGTSSANTVLATMRPPTIQAKITIGPPMICGSVRQTISRPTFAGEPEPALVPTTSTLIRRSLARVGFAIGSLSTIVRFLETELGAIASSLYRIEGPRTTWTKSSGRIRLANAALISPAFRFRYLSTSRTGSSSGKPVSARARRSSAISSSLDSLNGICRRRNALARCSSSAETSSVRICSTSCWISALAFNVFS